MTAANHSWEDDIYDDYYAPHECECLNPDYDLLEGRARCFSCGRSWWLSSAELKSLLKLDAQVQADYDHENRVEHSQWPPYCFIRWFRNLRHRLTPCNDCGKRFGDHSKCIPF